MRVDVEMHTGRIFEEDWSLEKIAYYILGCDLPHPRFENSLQHEWVPNYVSRARWDKQCLAKQDYERMIEVWPTDTPRPIRRERVDRLRVLYGIPEPTGSIGMTVDRAPRFFDQLLDVTVPHAEYDRFDYLSGNTAFKSKLAGWYLPWIARAVGFSDDLLSELPTEILAHEWDCILWEASENWGRPFDYNMWDWSDF